MNLIIAIPLMEIVHLTLHSHVSLAHNKVVMTYYNPYDYDILTIDNNNSPFALITASLIRPI